MLLVPAANLTNRDPVEFTALQRLAVGAVLGSDFWFWALSRLAPGQMIRTLLATDPALLDRVTPEERRRAERSSTGYADQPQGRRAADRWVLGRNAVAHRLSSGSPCRR